MPSHWLSAALAFAAAIAALAQFPAPLSSFHQQPDSAGVYYVGPQVLPPTITHAAPAESPDFPRGFQGGFSVWAMVIQPDGTPTDVHPVQSPGAAFDSAAARAIFASGFLPGNLNGRPVPVHIGVAVPFFRGVHPEPRIAILERDLDVAAAAAGRGANSPPILIHTAQAFYSSDDISAKYEAVVGISAVIGTDGIPTQVRVARRFGLGLDQYAMEAVQRYRYLPALKNGTPVPQKINVEVHCKIYWDPHEGDKFK